MKVELVIAEGALSNAVLPEKLLRRAPQRNFTFTINVSVLQN